MMGVSISSAVLVPLAVGRATVCEWFQARSPLRIRAREDGTKRKDDGKEDDDDDDKNDDGYSE